MRGILVRLRCAPGTEGAGRIADRFRFLGTGWKSGKYGESHAKTCEQPRPPRARTFQHSMWIKAKRPSVGWQERVLHRDRPLDKSFASAGGRAEELAKRARAKDYFAVTRLCVMACTESAMRFCTPTFRINLAT